MAEFKFIHAADLHIESPYRGISNWNKSLGKALVNHGSRAYDKLIDTCIEEQIDFLVIAGDSFDSDSGSLAAQYRFYSGLKRLYDHNIKAFVICGNHDPLSKWAENFTLPDNVTLFEADEVQQEMFAKDGKELAAIYGVSYGQQEEYRRLVELFKRSDQAEFSIALLHGTFAGRRAHTPYCPFDLGQLKASNMDYWALGHIHKREIIHETNPTVVYSGNLQGRHFNEEGEKGCYVVEVKNGTIEEMRFKPLSDVIFQRREMDATAIENTEDFFTALNDLRNTLKTDERSYMIRLTFTGMTPFYNVLTNHTEIDQLVQQFNSENDYSQPFVFLDKIENKAIPVIDLEERKQSSDFIADLIRNFDTHEVDETMLLKLQETIMEEINTGKVGRSTDTLSNPEELKSVLNSAKWKCITGLIGGKSER